MEMISGGFRRVTRSASFRTFPPNPIEFRAACFPTHEELGIPSLEAAYREATNNVGRSPEWRNWSHPASYQAACDAGFYTLKTGDEREAKALFSKAYENVTRRVMNGEKLQLPEEERLAKQPEKPCSKARSKEHLANLKANLGY